MVEKGFTLDDLIALLAPQVLQLPPNKRRDPRKRALLARLGDPVILAEERRVAPSEGEGTVQEGALEPKGPSRA